MYEKPFPIYFCMILIFYGFVNQLLYLACINCNDPLNVTLPVLIMTQIKTLFILICPLLTGRPVKRGHIIHLDI